MKFSNLFANLSEDMAAALLEFVGTAFFLIIGLGGIQAATAENLSSERPASNVQQVLYISTSMGFSLLVSAWLFFRITGGLFNPNVSLALLLVGAIKPIRFTLYCIAQLLGAIAGSAILRGLTSKSLSVKFVIGFSSSLVLFAQLHFQYISSKRYQYHARGFYRNVHYVHPCFISSHAGNGKTPGYCFRSCASLFYLFLPSSS